ncbi:MAG TPA: transcription termination/antitermination protein NusG [Pirellulaceae bacterium]|nr:transcription termination/antitermination protein NusG [Pirellulaceae bacterium]
MNVEPDRREETPQVSWIAETGDAVAEAGDSAASAEEATAANRVTEDDEAGALASGSPDAGGSSDIDAESAADLEGDPSADDLGDVDDVDEDQLNEDVDVEPLELIQDDIGSPDEVIKTEWYILKVQVNREESIRAALERKVKIEGLERYFGDIVVPTEDIAEFTKTGKRRIVKKKLYPGYIMVNMAINDDTWFAVRETSGIGDFTGSAGRPAPMDPADVERILKLGAEDEDGDQQVKTAIPFSVGDRVRVKDGYFQNFEGDVEGVDEANGRVTVMINIFGRSTPVELEHWQIESV